MEETREAHNKIKKNIYIYLCGYNKLTLTMRTRQRLCSNEIIIIIIMANIFSTKSTDEFSFRQQVQDAQIYAFCVDVCV